MDCDANSLAALAACLEGMTPAQQDAAQIALLCAIING